MDTYPPYALTIHSLGRSSSPPSFPSRLDEASIEEGLTNAVGEVDGPRRRVIVVRLLVCYN